MRVMIGLWIISLLLLLEETRGGIITEHSMDCVYDTPSDSSKFDHFKFTADKCKPCLWPQEVVPGYRTKYDTCVGGNGGAGFQIHRNDTTVESIVVWLGGHGNGFHAMKIGLFNGVERLFGLIPHGKSNSPTASFKFKPGEFLVGTLTISDNGHGTRVGYLYFKTSLGRTFEVGTLRRPYYFATQNSFLTGFHGSYGHEIDNLGVIMLAPVKSSKLFDVNYESTNELNQLLQPKSYLGLFCNLGSAPQSNQVSFKKTLGVKHEWEYESEFEQKYSVTIEAKVPIIKNGKEKEDQLEIEGSFKPEIAFETTTTTSTKIETLTQNTFSFPLIIPGNSFVKAEFFWYEVPINLTFTGTMQYSLLSGKTLSYNIRGKYSGLITSGIDANYSTFTVADYSDCLAYETM